MSLISLIKLKFLQFSSNFITTYQSSLVNYLKTQNHHFLNNSHRLVGKLINPAPDRLHTKSTAIVTSSKPYRLASSIINEFGKVPMLIMCMLIRVERVPFSNRLHLAFRTLPKSFSIFRIPFFSDIIVNGAMKGGEVLPSTHKKTLRVASIARKLGQGMHDTLGLKSEFNIIAYEPGNESNPVWTIGRRSGQALMRRSLCDIRRRKTWFKRNYSTDHLEGAEWKVTVIKTHESNAYLAPGKHIFVLTQLMDNCSDEELASIIGHEMGHAIGRHKTDIIMVEIFSCILEVALKTIFSSNQLLSSKEPNPKNPLTEIVKNYLSQRLELEADYIGMMLMASAGYDPRVAPVNLSKADFADGGHTHPDGCDRVEYLNDPERMKKAMCLFREYQLHKLIG